MSLENRNRTVIPYERTEKNGVPHFAVDSAVTGYGEALKQIALVVKYTSAQFKAPGSQPVSPDNLAGVVEYAGKNVLLRK